MRTERSKRFCTYNNEGAQADTITEVDLAKLEALQKKMRNAMAFQARDAEIEFGGPSETGRMETTVEMFLGELKRSKERKEERSIEEIIAYAQGGKVGEASGSSGSRVRRQPTLGSRIQRWGLAMGVNGLTRPIRVGVGIVKDFDENSLHVELQAVESFAEDSVDLGNNEDVLVSDLEEGDRIYWPNGNHSWRVVPQAVESGESTVAGSAGGALPQASRVSKAQSSGRRLRRLMKLADVINHDPPTQELPVPGSGELQDCDNPNLTEKSPGTAPETAPKPPAPQPAAAPRPAVPPRESYQRTMVVPPGTWREDLHKSDGADPLSCPSCKDRRSGNGKRTVGTKGKGGGAAKIRGHQKRPSPRRKRGK